VIGPRRYFCSVCSSKNIYSGYGDHSGCLSKTNGKWQGKTGRSQAHPFTGPDIIVDDEKTTIKEIVNSAEGLASQTRWKKLQSIVGV
jgi:hypothetical protein